MKTKHMKKHWILYGLYISLPNKEETWHEIESYKTYEDALLNASNTNQGGVIVKGYFAYRITERTYRDRIVYVSAEKSPDLRDEFLAAIPQQKQRHGSAFEQLRELRDFAKKLGLYEAVDCLEKLMPSTVNLGGF